MIRMFRSCSEAVAPSGTPHLSHEQQRVWGQLTDPKVSVGMAMWVASLRVKQGQEDGYLLWELWVVERGLKNASREDWQRNKETKSWKCPNTINEQRK